MFYNFISPYLFGLLQLSGFLETVFDFPFYLVMFRFAFFFLMHCFGHGRFWCGALSPFGGSDAPIRPWVVYVVFQFWLVVLGVF